MVRHANDVDSQAHIDSLLFASHERVRSAIGQVDDLVPIAKGPRVDMNGLPSHHSKFGRPEIVPERVIGARGAEINNPARGLSACRTGSKYFLSIASEASLAIKISVTPTKIGRQSRQGHSVAGSPRHLRAPLWLMPSTSSASRLRYTPYLLLPHLYHDVPRDLAALLRLVRLHDALERKARADLVEQPPGLAEPQHVGHPLVLGTLGHRVDEHGPNGHVLRHQRIERQLRLALAHRRVRRDRPPPRPSARGSPSRH